MGEANFNSYKISKSILSFRNYIVEISQLIQFRSFVHAFSPFLDSIFHLSTVVAVFVHGAKMLLGLLYATIAYENASHEFIHLSFFYFQPTQSAMDVEDFYCINDFPFNRMVHLALL